MSGLGAAVSQLIFSVVPRSKLADNTAFLTESNLLCTWTFQLALISRRLSRRDAKKSKIQKPHCVGNSHCGWLSAISHVIAIWFRIPVLASAFLHLHRANLFVLMITNRESNMNGWRSPHVWIEKLKVVKAPGTVKCRLVPNYMLISVFACKYEETSRKRPPKGVLQWRGAGPRRLKSLMGVTRHSDSTNYAHPMYYTLLPFFSSRATFRKWFEFLASNLCRSGRNSSGNFDIDTDKLITYPSNDLRSALKRSSLGRTDVEHKFSIFGKFQSSFSPSGGKKKKEINNNKTSENVSCVFILSRFSKRWALMNVHEVTL